MSALMSNTRLQAQGNLAVRQLRMVQALRQNNPRLSIAITVIIGLSAIVIGGLLLSVVIAQGVYEVSALKNQKTELAIKTQIIEQQVNSLSSSQNLADAAHVLGMVANANPVFLDVAKQEVHGKPMAAIANPQDRVAGNLVPNAAMVTKTTAHELKVAIAAKEAKATAKTKVTVSTGQTQTGKTGTAIPAPAWNASSKGNVVGQKNPSGQVGLPSGGIPVSPTH